jgi:hypothetical protein
MEITPALFTLPPEFFVVHQGLPREGPGSAAVNVRCAEAEGMRVLDSFPVGAKAWREYYGPLRRRVEELRGTAAGNPALLQVLEETDREIAVYDRHRSSFGYQFFLMQKA